MNHHCAWVNVTASVDTTNHVICGNTTSFSPFAVAGSSKDRIYIPIIEDQGSTW